MSSNPSLSKANITRMQASHGIRLSCSKTTNKHPVYSRKGTWFTRKILDSSVYTIYIILAPFWVETFLGTCGWKKLKFQRMRSVFLLPILLSCPARRLEIVLCSILVGLSKDQDGLNSVLFSNFFSVPSEDRPGSMYGFRGCYTFVLH
jgi:hypothetical protein